MIHDKFHEFRFVFLGKPVESETTIAAIVRAGCSDAALGIEQGVHFAQFRRSAATFDNAVLRAFGQVESVEGVRVARVEPDELVTASGIADRTGRTRQSISLLVSGQRGPGGFPPPTLRLDGRTRVWRWSIVRRWLSAHEGAVDDHGLQDAQHSSFVAALNGALAARQYLLDYGTEGGGLDLGALLADVVLGHSPDAPSESHLDTLPRFIREIALGETSDSDCDAFVAYTRVGLRHLEDPIVPASLARVTQLSRLVAAQLEAVDDATCLPIAAMLEKASIAHDAALRLRANGRVGAATRFEADSLRACSIVLAGSTRPQSLRSYLLADLSSSCLPHYTASHIDRYAYKAGKTRMFAVGARTGAYFAPPNTSGRATLLWPWFTNNCFSRIAELRLKDALGPTQSYDALVVAARRASDLLESVGNHPTDEPIRYWPDRKEGGSLVYIPPESEPLTSLQFCVYLDLFGEGDPLGHHYDAMTGVLGRDSELSTLEVGSWLLAATLRVVADDFLPSAARSDVDECIAMLEAEVRARSIE